MRSCCPGAVAELAPVARLPGKASPPVFIFPPAPIPPRVYRPGDGWDWLLWERPASDRSPQPIPVGIGPNASDRAEPQDPKGTDPRNRSPPGWVREPIPRSGIGWDRFPRNQGSHSHSRGSGCQVSGPPRRRSPLPGRCPRGPCCAQPGQAPDCETRSQRRAVRRAAR